MRSSARPADANAAQPAESSHATAQAAAEEECFRAVVDLREVAQKLDKHQFQEKAKLLENVDNKAMMVPSNRLLSMFDPATWTQCLSEFWYGDALPNMVGKQKPRLTFEELFETLPDREDRASVNPPFCQSPSAKVGRCRASKTMIPSGSPTWPFWVDPHKLLFWRPRQRPSNFGHPKTAK